MNFNVNNLDNIIKYIIEETDYKLGSRGVKSLFKKFVDRKLFNFIINKKEEIESFYENKKEHAAIICNFLNNNIDFSLSEV